MSDKDSKWSDYWSEYKPKISKSNKIKFGKKLSLPKINKQLVLLIASVIVIIILGLFYFRTGNYAKVLESDISELEGQVISCKDQSQSFSSLLDTCKADLAICDTNVTSNIMALERCQKENEDFSPTTCQERYVKLKENYIHYKCCQVEGVYKSYDILDGMEINCRTDTLGFFELEC